MKRNMCYKKRIDVLQKEAFNDTHGLKRALSALDLTSLGIGGIIGAGIFVLTGHAAASYAGPGIVLSFIFAFVVCGFAGLCYAELASMIPIAGSAYLYSYAIMGEFIAWIVGWDLILEYFLGASTVAIGWSGYVISFLNDIGINVPAIISGSPLSYNVQTHEWILTGKLINLPAFLIIIFVTLILIVGVKKSAMFNSVIVMIKVSILLVFIAMGVFHLNSSLWTPFIPPNTGEFGHFGFSGVLRGASVVFFAYIGFDTVSTAASEAKNPQKNLPIGILVSLFVCTALYIAVAFILTGVVHYSHLNVSAPIAVALDAMKMGFLTPMVKIGAIAGLSSVILVLLYGQIRVFYAIAKDGLLPKVFAKVHTKYSTPHVATIATGIMASIAASILPIDIAGELVSIGTLMAFLLVCTGVLILRFTQPTMKRHFKTPGGIFVPIGGILSCLYLMVGLPFDTWMRLVIWLIIGFVIYFTYGIHKANRTHKNV
ncbi:MAG: amino acid permease [Candidatus Magnetoovum sp. WYHC-5]|nr:amino acid permease [Candidatus Magnetoovum sp. WYHC-5]